MNGAPAIASRAGVRMTYLLFVGAGLVRGHRGRGLFGDGRRSAGTGLICGGRYSAAAR
ncbi:hypothetical protein GCM10022205_42490 [Spinactinospora alkalitolerans]